MPGEGVRRGAATGGPVHSPSRPDAGEAWHLVLVRLGERAFALPASGVERILRMAALTPLPGAPSGVLGVLNLHGTMLVAVDPRPRVGLSAPAMHAQQRLLVVSARTHYVLWVDEVEGIVSARTQDVDGIEIAAGGMPAPWIVRLDGEVIPVLSPEALDPGPIVRPASERAP